MVVYVHLPGWYLYVDKGFFSFLCFFCLHSTARLEFLPFFCVFFISPRHEDRLSYHSIRDCAEVPWKTELRMPWGSPSRKLSVDQRMRICELTEETGSTHVSASLSPCHTNLDLSFYLSVYLSICMSICDTLIDSKVSMRLKRDTYTERSSISSLLYGRYVIVYLCLFVSSFRFCMSILAVISGRDPRETRPFFVVYFFPTRGERKRKRKSHARAAGARCTV